MSLLKQILPLRTLATLYLRWFGFSKIPLLFYVRPSVVLLNNEKVVVRIPFRRRTQNHLKSMYFGALAIGADCAGGLIAMQQIRASKEPVALIFKSLHADFLKRAEGDVFFTCTQGKEIAALVTKAIRCGERVEMPLKISATVPSKFGDEPVAIFTLVLSLKNKKDEVPVTS